MGLYDWDKSLNFQVQTRQGADYQEELLGRALRREGICESLQSIAFSLTGFSAFSKCDSTQIKRMDSNRAAPSCPTNEEG